MRDVVDEKVLGYFSFRGSFRGYPCLVSRGPLSGSEEIDENANLTRLHSANFPFLPKATFQHGGCVARVSYHSSPRPPNNGHPFGFVETAQQQRFTSSRPLSNASIFKVWTAAKAAAQIIANKCTPNDRNGVSWVAVDIPEMDGVWCAVHILGFNTRGWEHRARMEGWHALRGYSRGQRDTGGSFGNKFKTAIVDMP